MCDCRLQPRMAVFFAAGTFGQSTSLQGPFSVPLSGLPSFDRPLFDRPIAMCLLSSPPLLPFHFFLKLSALVYFSWILVVSTQKKAAQLAFASLLHSCTAILPFLPYAFHEIGLDSQFAMSNYQPLFIHQQHG